MEPIDDEIVVTVRLRVDGRETLDDVTDEALSVLPSRLHTAVADLLVNRHAGIELAGVEVALPTLRPYNVPRTVHEFLPPDRQVTPLRP